MIRYAIYLPLQLLCMVLCYLTNWLVVIFADEEGELPGLLRLWQTWDDTLDNSTDVGRMPKILQYDWDAHYIQGHKLECGRIRYTERLIKPFSLADRIRRYCCRVHWLYRNCAYGFAFYLFGALEDLPGLEAPADHADGLPGNDRYQAVVQPQVKTPPGLAPGGLFFCLNLYYIYKTC